jgi:hypothetical protein
VTTTASETAAAADFVQRFEETWADPSPERLNALLHADVRLVQPLEREIRGHAQATAAWKRSFGLIPDLRGEVLEWAERDGFLVISIRLHGTVGRRPVEWISSDHIRLEDGLVRERIAYFDPLPLVGAVLRSPGVWPRFAALQLRR